MRSLVDGRYRPIEIGSEAGFAGLAKLEKREFGQRALREPRVGVESGEDMCFEVVLEGGRGTTSSVMPTARRGAYRSQQLVFLFCPSSILFLLLRESILDRRHVEPRCVGSHNHRCLLCQLSVGRQDLDSPL